MAYKRYANAIMARQDIRFEEWMDEYREQNECCVSKDHVGRIAKQVLRKCDPAQYLLSHATIVASVDTYEPKGAQIGRRMERGVQIESRWPNYRIKPECQDIINNNCCPPGTMILMADGTEKPIEEVEVGDSVISHTGHARQVVKTFVHPHNGPIYEIRRRGDSRHLTVTGEHPVYSHRPRRVGARTILAEESRFSFVSAGLLRKYDLLVTPRLQKTRASGITPGKAKLIGYFLAEGYFYKQARDRVSEGFRNAFPGLNSIPCSLQFALCKDESDTLAADIRTLLREEFGVDSEVASHGSSENAIVVTSRRSLELVQFFLRHCGQGARSKRVSPEVMALDPSLQLLVLQGWLEGDGTVKKTLTGWLSSCTASEDLASQIVHIFHRCGIVASIHRTVRNGRKRLRMANGGWTVVNDPSKTSFANIITINSVDAEQAVRGSWLERAHRTAASVLKKHNFLKFRVQPGKIVTQVLGIVSRPYCGFVHNFETEVDHSYVANGVAVHNSDAWERSLLLSTYRTFIGAPNYLEHIQLPELSKGFIVDAIARDLGKTCYVDILVATDRKHEMLVRDIVAERINAMSMGCISLFTICNRCGNVAVDDSQLCPCIMYDGKGTKFTDSEGVEHVLAELIGHVSVPNSNQFIEASWVRNPAFRGAMRRNILNPDNSAVAVRMSDSAKVYELRRDEMNIDGVLRAASWRLAQDPAEEPLGEDPGTAEELDALGLDEGADAGTEGGEPGADAVADAGADAGAEGGAEGGEPGAEGGAEEVEPASPIREMLDKAKELILEELVKSLSEELAPKPEDVGTATPAVSDVMAGNDSLVRSFEEFDRKLRGAFPNAPRLVRWASRAYRIVHGGGVQGLRKAGMTPRDLIVLSWIEDSVGSRIYPPDLYRVAMDVGSPRAYPSRTSYLAACKVRLGRGPTRDEIRFLSWKGRIASLSTIF